MYEQQPPKRATSPFVEPDRLRSDLVDTLRYAIGKDESHATAHDWMAALMRLSRRYAVNRWIETTQEAYETRRKRIYYLSMEFLIGRILEDGLRNMQLLDRAREALWGLGVDLDLVLKAEPDPALGNGGLGRLAACYMESMASVGIHAMGYGIRYENGLFHQDIRDGWQIEAPDAWLARGSHWEFERPEASYDIGFYGSTQQQGEAWHWHPGQAVQAVAFDMPIIGWQAAQINTLRLWSAQAQDPIDLAAFDQGDYLGAFGERFRSEAISQLLYPNDSTEAGKVLRLKQEYFFSAASIQDILRRHKQQGFSVEALPDQVSIQLNDTHPAIAIPELIRLLVDQHGLTLAKATDIARRSFNYTNHTLLPEALERWPLSMLGQLLPRHMQLIYEMNAELLETLRRKPDNPDPFLSDVSLIDEQGGGQVRMGHLAFMHSSHTNGVSALHSELVQSRLFRALDRHFPGRILNVTNGVTPRRWLLGCNPGLAGLLTDKLGDQWIGDLARIQDFEAHIEAEEVRETFRAAKHANKQRLADFVQDRLGVQLNPSALFDVQIKRIHEYKRQQLNIMETIAHYLAILREPNRDWVPVVKIFSGKAAAAYTRAKEIIRLITAVAEQVNQDPRIGDRLKVVFLPNYNVSLAELVIPAADLSEQISTAGMEASGTGNMKFALNGALTIGTLDGATVEMRAHIGTENMLTFGLTAEEVEARRARGAPPLSDDARKDPVLAEVLEKLSAGSLTPDSPGQFRALVNELRFYDYFMVLADFAAYRDAQAEARARFANPDLWTRQAMLNVARMGWFSSDRSVRDYARDIWQVSPKF
jgi:starch phosphorylase